jgi:hypothetical protein
MPSGVPPIAVEYAGFSPCAAAGKPQRLKPLRTERFGGIAEAMPRYKSFLKLHHYREEGRLRIASALLLCCVPGRIEEHLRRRFAACN